MSESWISVFLFLQVRDEYIKWLTCTCGKDVVVVSVWKFRQPFTSTWARRDVKHLMWSWKTCSGRETLPPSLRIWTSKQLTGKRMMTSPDEDKKKYVPIYPFLFLYFTKHERMLSVTRKHISNASLLDVVKKLQLSFFCDLKLQFYAGQGYNLPY